MGIREDNIMDKPFTRDEAWELMENGLLDGDEINHVFDYIEYLEQLTNCSECGGTENKHYLNCSIWQKMKNK